MKCFHHKCKKTQTSKLVPYFPFISQHSPPCPTKQRILWEPSSGVRGHFFSMLFNRILTHLCSWQEHRTSKLKTHSGMYTWSLYKLSHTCDSIGFTHSLSRYWWTELSGNCSAVKIGLVCTVCEFLVYWAGPAMGLPFSKRGLAF